MHGDGNTRHYQTLRHQPDHARAARAGFKAEVAKLIDVSSCVGCKACQVACSEWNDIRDEVGHCVGVYDNPPI
jgi:Fe-S-cluster-containing dehydrogenase component